MLRILKVDDQGEPLPFACFEATRSPKRWRGWRTLGECL